jgi:hypothetical protein
VGAADLESIQSVGAAAAGGPSGGAARQAALEAGVREGVLQVAAEVAQETGPPPDPAALKSALGSDLEIYAVRFHIVEDRGEHPALLIQEPGVDREYEVLVDVEVDRGSIRSRLAKAGLVKAAPPPPTAHRSLEIDLEGIQSYGTWEQLRRALGERGGSVRPVEFSHGRVLARVDTDEAPEALVERLRHSVGDSMGLALRSAEGQQVRIEVTPGSSSSHAAPPASPAPAPPPTAPPRPGATPEPPSKAP